MTDDTFDLTERPWIPCETLDGGLVELGLTEVLVRAHELRAVCDPSPLVTAALHRLLLAVLHRVFGPESLDEWKELYRAQRFDEGRLRQYLEAWRHRFRLFDAERPFYQVRGLPFEADGVQRLVFERSNYGTAVKLFQHEVPERSTLSPAEAVRGLLSLQLFAPGGLVKKPGEPTSATAAPLNRGAMTLLTGATLRETLVLNLCVYAPDEGQPIVGERERDAPAWERDVTRIEKRAPDGWLDLLTWQSRRLELVRNDEGRVCGVTYCVGQELDTVGGLLDPMLAFRVDPKRGMVPIEFQLEREIWRDSHALVSAVDPARVRPPAAVRQLADRELRDTVPRERRFRLELLGMRGDRAIIHFSRHERFPVSVRMFDDPDVGRCIEETIATAEAFVQALRAALWRLAERSLTTGERRVDGTDVRNLVDHLGAERRAWADMASPFEEFLRDVADAPEEARKTFVERARRSVLDAHAAAARAIGVNARALQAGATSEVVLRAKLNELVQPNKEVA